MAGRWKCLKPFYSSQEFNGIRPCCYYRVSRLKLEADIVLAPKLRWFQVLAYVGNPKIKTKSVGWISNAHPAEPVDARCLSTFWFIVTDLNRSWFDKALLSETEGCNTNGLTLKLSRLQLVAKLFIICESVASLIGRVFFASQSIDLLSGLGRQIMRYTRLLLQIADFPLNNPKQMTVMDQPSVVLIDFNGGCFWVETNHLAEEIIILFILEANPGANF